MVGVGSCPGAESQGILSHIVLGEQGNSDRVSGFSFTRYLPHKPLVAVILDPD